MRLNLMFPSACKILDGFSQTEFMFDIKLMYRCKILILFSEKLL